MAEFLRLDCPCRQQLAHRLVASGGGQKFSSLAMANMLHFSRPCRGPHLLQSPARIWPHPFRNCRFSGARSSVVVVAAGASPKGKTKSKPTQLPMPQLSAPTLTETSKNSSEDVEVSKTKVQETQQGKVVMRVVSSGDKGLQNLGKKVVRQLASLPLAIAELFAIAGLSAVGTLIAQGETPNWYFENYPDSHPVLGFLSWQWILALGLDHVYTAPIFLGLLVMLAASLMACTSTTQLPIVKVARR